jgi:hypothetical protein
MRIDLYTKVMLTIIAACLAYLSVGGRSLIADARAESEASRVLIAGWIDAEGHVQRLPPAAGRVLALPVDTFRR